MFDGLIVSLNYTVILVCSFKWKLVTIQSHTEILFLINTMMVSGHGETK